MATLAGKFFQSAGKSDALVGTERAHALDRWIFVGMAVWFIAIVLAGFIPDSIMKVGMVEAGTRPPFPLVLHMHALAMGSFLLLLLTQSVLMASGRSELHKRVGIAAFIFVPVLVVIGLVLAPTIYHQVWHGAQVAPPALQAKMQERLLELDNILLMQMRIGILFPLLMAIGLRARSGNSGLHKRMMFLATAMPLPAAINRLTWLPTTVPASPLSIELYILLAISPLFVWDVVRNRRVHEAYWIWLACWLPFAALTDSLWGTPWWHSTARAIMGV